MESPEQGGAQTPNSLEALTEQVRAGEAKSANASGRTTKIQDVAATKDLRNLLQGGNRILIYLGGGIIALAALYFAYQRFYISPQADEAQRAMINTVRYFEQDSFDLALNGDGTEFGEGLRDIADGYGGTKPAQLARYMAGLSLMHKGQYEEALDYLEKARLDSKEVSALRLGAIGDCYSQLKEYDEAASNYSKAAKKVDNEYITPRFLKKAGLVYEQLDEPKKAAEAYEEIRDHYSKTPEGQDIVKYLARAQAKAGLPVQ